MNTKTYKKNKTPQMKTVGKTSKPKIDKNQLLAIILAVLIIFWTVASVFGMIAYGKISRKTSNVISASAETVDYYNTHDSLIIELPHLSGLTYVSALNVGAETVTILPSLYLEVTTNSIILFGGSSSNILERSGVAFTPFNLSLRSASSLVELTTQYVTFACTKLSNVSMPVFADWSLMSDIKLTYVIQYISSTSVTQFCFDLKIDFTYDNASYSFRYRFADDLGLALPSTNCKFYVPFTNTFTTNSIRTFANNDAYGFPLVDFIKYYNISSTFDPDALLSYDLGVTDGIKIGKEQGHAIGFSEGYQNGYEDGYTEGNTEGYDNGRDVGYQEGLEASQEYSFTSLIGAVIDVPVRTFTSLFSFDILGVNLSVFFFSLLTLAIILAVVRTLL